MKLVFLVHAIIAATIAAIVTGISKASTGTHATVSTITRDAVVGAGGTGVVVGLEGWKSGAAIFAAVCTGLWMLTQIGLALHARFVANKSQPPP